MRTALGFRAHSGWAAMVAVAGTIDAPRVLERRRIVIADAEMPGSKQPYHAAAELPFPNAEALVRKAVESRVRWRGKPCRPQSKRFAGRGMKSAGAVSYSAPARRLPGLEGILASHALIHTAEGEMFREVLVWAAHECRLAVTGVREKGLDGGR